MLARDHVLSSWNMNKMIKVISIIITAETEVKRTDNDLIFSDEKSLSAPLTNAFTETFSQQSDINIGNSDLATQNMAEETVKEAENTCKRSHSEFIEYEQNNEGLSVLSSPLNKTSSQSDTNIGTSDLALAQIAKVQKPRKYINQNIADNVLKMYQISILLGEKLMFNGTQNMAKETVKEAENAHKRSYFEFIKYEQNDEGLLVLSSLLRNSDLALAQIAKVQKPRKYINQDIADDVLKMYQMSILPDEKLMFNGVNILDSALLDMKKMKKTEVAKSPLNIHVINFHNLDCMKYLSYNYSNYIADQIQDQNSEADNFADRKKIDKFIVDCDTMKIFI
ncbi:hypothetical protein RhiirA4_471072 [Rhizophagus irregularis]|uniref:Uncharacterized protein n=1 Tax=Rhizophagus irregularis TaxID=588596 RepID=A0A2I1H2D9_9GLOM|nr:hypothetical protein RhiirA4_471072 [Rhizophagus irregularis]